MVFNQIWDRVKGITGWKNQSEMAAFLGIAGSNISEAKGRDRFPYAWMEKIAAKFDVSIDWLLTGKNYLSFPEKSDTQRVDKLPENRGGPLKVHFKYQDKAASPTETPASNDHVESWTPPDVREFVFIPLIDAELNAGNGMFVLSEAEGIRLAFRRDWIMQKSTNLDNLFLMTVRGTSMEDTLKDGDTVLVDLGRKSIHAGGMYAVGVGEMVYIKKLELLVGGRVRVISYNRKEFSPYEVEEADLRILGQVIWCGRELM